MSSSNTNTSGIRLAILDDIDRIVEIENSCFPVPTAYSRSHLASLISGRHSSCLVEINDGVIRGFVVICYRRWRSIGDIETIDVDPTFHSRGIGLKLLRAAEVEMKLHGRRCAQLEVSEGNAAAIKLYTKAGYVFKERLGNYYFHEHHGTRHAIRMVKTL
jgi:ribosomal protein S18 acetylase RimI-like enzyme